MGGTRDLTADEIRAREYNTSVELLQGKPLREEIYSCDRRITDNHSFVIVALGVAALLGALVGWVARVVWIKWFIN